MQTRYRKFLLYISVIIAVLVMISSGGGIYLRSTYANETEIWRVQAIAQDWFDLLFISPLLVGFGVATSGNHKTGYFIFCGSLLFVVYTFAIYCFATHFNTFFLIYCLILGLAIYTLAWLFLSPESYRPAGWFDDKYPAKTVGSFLLSVAILFYLLWLSEIIPAILQRRTPRSVIEAGLLTNPVHVLDLSVFLPLMFLTAVLIFKKKQVAFLLAPPLLVFNVLMSSNIAFLLIFMQQKGLGNSSWIAATMVLFALISLFLLLYSLRHLKLNSIIQAKKSGV